MITVVGMFSKFESDSNTVVVNTTSRSDVPWQTELSPFNLGPVELYSGYVSNNVENAWQFSKVYAKHIGWDKNPTDDYWKWATSGWADTYAHRYPMGKGAIPKYSYWDGVKLDYVDARKKIYAPLYAESVVKTNGWKKLVKLHHSGKNIVLRDFDGYDNKKLGMSLSDVMNNAKKKTGHAFILAMLLDYDPAIRLIKTKQRWLPLLNETLGRDG